MHISLPGPIQPRPARLAPSTPFTSRQRSMRRHYRACVFAAVCAAAALVTRPARAQLSGVTGAHDPSSLVKEGSTYYYFATGQGIVSRTSTNRLNWSAGPSVFASPPAWTTQAVSGFTGSFWAPDVAYFNGLWHVYYSASSWGTIDSAIGVATSPTLANAVWTDQGKVVQSDAVGQTSPQTDTTAYNAIDPSILVDTNGSVYMSFGSYSSGILVTQIDPSSGKRLNTASLVATQVANNAPGGGWGSSIEGSALVKKGTYYYLFVNYGGCCDGVNSTYNIRVGRSSSPTGPFLDKNGAPMTQGGGTLFLDDDGKMIGPGHFSIYSEAGQDYFGYHYYNGDFNGAPTYGLRNLYWTADNWPSYAAVNPNWTGTTNANWSDATNWSVGGVPNGVGHVANFSSNAFARYSITVDGSGKTISSINFQGSSPYLIGANNGNTLTLDAITGDMATLNVSAGSHTIAAPITALDNLGVDVRLNTSRLTLSGAMTALGLTTYGFGTLTLADPATFSNPILHKWGTIEITGNITASGYTSLAPLAAENATIVIRSNGTYTANADFNVGDTGNATDTATGTLFLQDNAKLTINSAGGFFVGSGFNSNTKATGTVNQTGGTLTANGNFDGAFIIGGRASALATGTYNLSAGTVIANTNVRVGGNGTGTVNQSGGTFTSPNYISIGRFSGAKGAWNISGGALSATGAGTWLIVGESGSGTLSLSSNALVSTANVIRMGHTGGSGTINLNGGTLITTGIQRGTGSATVNFNGGRIVGSADSATFLQGLSSAVVKSGGALVDTNGHNLTIAQALSHDSTLGTTPDGGLAKFGNGTLTLNAAVSYTGPTTINAGLLRITQSNLNLHAISGNGDLFIQSITSVTSDTVAVNTFDILGSHTLRAGGTTASKVNTLVIEGSTDAWSGRLDLTNNALVLQTTDPADKAAKLANLQNQVASGIAGGNGITSSTVTAGSGVTLAIADNADLGLPLFHGQVVDGNSLILTQAQNGDASLDGKVDSFDLNILAAHWQQPAGALWSAGDFNGDGKVDSFDLNVLAANWQYGASLESALAAVAVPEPGSLSLLALAGLPLLARRRRGSSPGTTGLGDLVAAIANPIARTINALAGTRLGTDENCACKRRRDFLNRLLPNLARPFTMTR